MLRFVNGLPQNPAPTCSAPQPGFSERCGLACGKGRSSCADLARNEMSWTGLDGLFAESVRKRSGLSE